MSFHLFLHHLYDHLIFMSHQETAFDPTKPSLFLRGIQQSNIVLSFYLDQKLKDPVENSSGTFKGKENTGNQGERE